MTVKGFIVTWKDNLDEVFYLTCPICNKVMEEDATAFEDYHTVFDCPEEDDRLTGYMWCFGDCKRVYIVDAFTKPCKIDFEELPENLCEKVRTDKYYSADECDFYSVNYAKVKEFVNNDLLALKCDHKLSIPEIKHILESARRGDRSKLVFDEDVLQQYGVEHEDDSDWDDDSEKRERKFNLGNPVDSYDPFDAEGSNRRDRNGWFRMDHDGVDNLLKCVSADGREFDFILSGD